MGLFDKKYCDVCGEKIGLLGNRKLEDGNLCKNCAAKLSPWFDDRRHTGVAEIKEQLAYREENKQAVTAFHMSRSFGKRYTILMIDEEARTFAVAGKNDLADGNPDIVECSKITGVNCDTQEHRTELKMKDKEGKMVSYNPPRYEYSYDFYCEIHVDHPYFDQMRFQLNSTAVKMQPQRSLNTKSFVKSTFTPGQADYQKFIDMGSEISNVLMSLRDGASSSDEVQVPLTWQNGLLYHYTNSYGLDVSMSYTMDGQLTYKITDPQFYKYQADQIPYKVQMIITKYLMSLEGSGTDPVTVADQKQELCEYIKNNSAEINKSLGIEVTDFQITTFELDQTSKAILAQFQSMLNQAGNPQPTMQPVFTQAQSNDWTCEFCGSKNSGGRFCTECGAPRN